MGGFRFVVQKAAPMPVRIGRKKLQNNDVSCFVELSPCLDSYSIKLIVVEKDLSSNSWNIGDHQPGVWWQGKHVVVEFRAGSL